MTNEFKEKMNKAMEKAVIVARKQDKEHLEKVKLNQQFADLYMELVLALVEQYDFHTGEFHTEIVSKAFLEKFGNPQKIYAWISEENQKGTIAINYVDKDNCWLRHGEPEFKKYDYFDLDIINDILAENDISIYEDHIDGGGMGSQNDYIYFNASMLIETRNRLMEEAPNQYKRF